MRSSISLQTGQNHSVTTGLRPNRYLQYTHYQTDLYSTCEPDVQNFPPAARPDLGATADSDEHSVADRQDPPSVADGETEPSDEERAAHPHAARLEPDSGEPVDGTVYDHRSRGAPPAPRRRGRTR